MTIDDIVEMLYSSNSELVKDKKKYDRNLLEDVEFLAEFIRYKKFLDEDPEYADISEQEKLNDAMNYTKKEKYFKMLYPDYKGLTSRQKYSAQDDREFIGENIESIDEWFIRLHPESQSALLTPNEQIKEAIYIIKEDKYFAMLHPEYAQMPAVEKMKLRHNDRILYEILQNDYNIICENIAAMDRHLSANESIDRESIEFVVNHYKVEKYFELLHPDYAKLSMREQWQMEDTSIYDNDRSFLYDNIAAVERKFIEMQLSSDVKNISEQEKLRAAIDMTKAEIESREVIQDNREQDGKNPQIGVEEKQTSSIASKRDALHVLKGQSKELGKQVMTAEKTNPSQNV